MSRNPETLARRLVDELGRVTDNQRAASDGLRQVCPGGQAVDRRRLLQSCVGPVLATDEPSDNQPAAERLRWRRPIWIARRCMQRWLIGRSEPYASGPGILVNANGEAPASACHESSISNV
jgi:hypothetical protein